MHTAIHVPRASFSARNAVTTPTPKSSRYWLAEHSAFPPVESSKKSTNTNVSSNHEACQKIASGAKYAHYHAESRQSRFFSSPTEPISAVRTSL